MTLTAEHAWLPRAICDVGCVRFGADGRGRRGAVALRTALRMAAASALFSVTWLLVIPMPGRSHLQRAYCRLMLRSLGVRMSLSGGPIRNLRGVLVVSGHVSWLDILAIGTVLPGSFVARADLTHWPVLGPVVRMMGVIPIDRARLSRLPSVVASVADRLRAGHTVVAFPEGTTWCGLG
ncbi:MAG: 1-acyl-sn-glycerol-3-phosphate acyltransferase, partial [Actinomycetia bacterium]|nr:1-acyl-sn-glycerol-3-phosphate acyltransferase [Actinomycetes bacterium]